MRSQILSLIPILALSATAKPLGHVHHHLHHVTVPSAPLGSAAVPAPPAGSASPAESPAPASPAGSAAPVASGSAGSGADGNTFQIAVTNNCGETKQFAIYQITSSFSVNQISSPVSIANGQSQTINAPFSGIGMRLSGEAQLGTAGQWTPQPLFEFGYSEYAGQSGTAYDASVMTGSTSGIAIYPSNSQCPSKYCTPENCAADQGWTNPNQVDAGSPGDTVCYQGKTNFAVTWCP